MQGREAGSSQAAFKDRGWMDGEQVLRSAQGTVQGLGRDRGVSIWNRGKKMIVCV